MSSVPLAAPWNGADKNLARLLVEHDRAHEFIVQTSAASVWPDHVRRVVDHAGGALPTNTQKLRALAYVLRHQSEADLVHVVASLQQPSPLTARLLRTVATQRGRPLLHTLPSIGAGPVEPAHFPGDLNVVVSEHTRARLLAHGITNVHRIYPPVDARHLRPRSAPETLAQTLGLGRHAVLYPAHYGPHSGLREMIAAFAALPAGLAGARLVLACRIHPGMDPAVEEARVRAWAAAAGIGARLLVLPKVDDMPALLAACAVTVLVPERLDAKMDLPLVILEALALGRPVVIGDQPPLSEALLGSGGERVRYGDVAALSAALARLLADVELRARLGAQGAAAVRALCAPASVVARYQEFYQALCARPAPARTAAVR